MCSYSSNTVITDNTPHYMVSLHQPHYLAMESLIITKQELRQHKYDVYKCSNPVAQLQNSDQPP